MVYSMNINECIIIGGGSSITEGISLGLRDKIKDKFVIACNYSYKHFSHTLLTCVDKDFYYSSNSNHPNIYEELKEEKLIITNADITKNLILLNTILVKRTNNYNENPLQSGFYNGGLTGIFSLSLAQFILNYTGTIFLLGFDWSRQPIPEDKTKYKSVCNLDIHYYKKEIQHRGVGYTGFYDNHNPNNSFKFFNNKNIKIYNVSLNSNIDNFEKISYKKMFGLLSPNTYEQNSLQTYIKQILN